ncbi:hypothetical protein FIBSPDRAFT_854054 [Athelia psychrophila]|uniref:Ribosomal protein S15 n=1 Tax=Athelia psychrophila TaxID=1759441 RepID=A0A166QJE7_9AGAM|nr:hypothetical protein FIBSPDRAFT_854054 [Fibularhizoctonia sp. CBS 109695]
MSSSTSSSLPACPTPSSIGETLRDSHGIPQVRFVTGNKILRVFKSNSASPSPRLSSLPSPRVSYADCFCYLSSLRSRSCSPSFTDPFLFVDRLAPSIPEDLWFLVKKAVAVRKHLEVNRKDKDSMFRLILIESRIHRLARYYKTKQQIPRTFKYDSATASTLIA